MNLMIKWEELFQIASSISFTEDNDDIIWKYESKGNYSVHSLYAVVNFRGVVPVHIPAVWKLDIPPRVHIFLWLLSNNKLLSRDNLSKRRTIDDLTCQFCCEVESVPHLFFGCCVVKLVLSDISDLIRKSVGQDFESAVGGSATRKMG